LVADLPPERVGDGAQVALGVVGKADQALVCPAALADGGRAALGVVITGVSQLDTLWIVLPFVLPEIIE
jgi:hypothetical protein